jgi:DNA-binding NarL/FixJ family response regulator
MKTHENPASDHRRILIVDDHPLTRMGLTHVIGHEPDLQVCGEAATAAEALRSIESARPDLVITDIGLPEKNGLELIKDIHAIHPDMPVIVVSMHDESLFAERALRAGARGYVMKHEGGKCVVNAVRKVLGGGISVSSNVAHTIFCGLAGGGAGGASPSMDPAVNHLSKRELEVYRLIGDGLGRHEIARKLGISIKTADVHRANIRTKLGLGSSVELTRHAAIWAEAETSGLAGGG